MHFKVEQEIFEKLPNACFGVVVAKGIDNTKAYVNHIIKRTDSVVNKTFAQMME